MAEKINIRKLTSEDLNKIAKDAEQLKPMLELEPDMQLKTQQYKPLGYKQPEPTPPQFDSVLGPGYIKNRKGVGICIITRGTVPVKWMMHMNRLVKFNPGGLFWKFIVVERLSWAAARSECVRRCRAHNFKYLLFCFKGDEEVETDGGMKRIDSIKLGGLVKTHKGRFRKVLRIYRIPYKQQWPIIKVHTAYSNIECTPDHPFYVVGGNWIPAQNLTPTDKLLYPSSGKEDQLEFGVWLRDRGESGFGVQKYHNHKIDWLEVDESLAMFLGYYLAEGCASNDGIRFTFNNKEKSYIDFIKSVCEQKFGRAPTIYTRWATDVKLNIRSFSKLFCDWFGGNAREKRIPAFVFDWNLKNKIAFLKAYIDGDGTYIKSGNSSMVTASEALCDDLKRFLIECGIGYNGEYHYGPRSSSKRANKRYILSTGSYIITLSKQKTNKILDLFYGRRNNTGDIIIPITQIEHKGMPALRKQFVYNLEVEEDNSYIVGSVAVHNCDDDVFLPDDAIDRMLKANKDIVSGVYWTKTEHTSPVIFKEMGGGPMYEFPVDELIEIGGSGLGCCLIRMDVFDKFDEQGIPYFVENWIYTTPDGIKMRCPIGEDHYFFIKAKELGYRAWCDSGILCDHYDYKNDIFYPGEKVVRDIVSKKLKSEGRQDVIDAVSKSQQDPAKKTIIFYNQSTFSGDELERRGVGGAETAMINLARELYKQNYNVKVYCNCLRPGRYDGVWYKYYKDLYKDLIEFNGCDSLIISREQAILLAEPELKQKYNIKQLVLWAHDMAADPAWVGFEVTAPKFDAVVMLSKFHRNELFERYLSIASKTNFVIIGNGVNPNLYKKDIKKVKGRCIYSSTPFRGLDLLLEMWPQIKKRVPHAELYIFSSIKHYGEQYDDSPWDHLYTAAKQMPGVVYHGSVLQSRLAEEQLKAELLLYPNTFKETYCITAAECQTAGIPIISTKLGALPETVKPNCGILIDADPYSINYQKQFIETAVRLLTSDEINNMSKECLKHDFSWPTRAKEWGDRVFSKKGELEIKGAPTSSLNVPNKIIGQTNSERDTYFKQMLEKQQFGYDEYKYNLFKQFISQDYKILVVNCGLGELPRFLKQNLPKAEIWGSEESLFALDYCRQSNKQIYFANHPVSNIEFESGYFDVIIVENFDLIKDKETFMQHINRIRASKSVMIATMPISYWNPNQIKKFFKDSLVIFHSSKSAEIIFSVRWLIKE